MQSIENETFEKIFVEAIRYLVFSGAGVKGLAYGPALETLVTEVGLDLRRVKAVAGTSAGALEVLLLSLGYGCRACTQALEEVLSSEYFRQHTDKAGRKALRTMEAPRLFRPVKAVKAAPISIHNLRSNYGMVSSDPIWQWCHEKIRAKTRAHRINDLTFAELADLAENYPEQGFKKLVVIGSNLNTRRRVVFSAETTPRALVAQAVVISTSVPVMFPPRKIHFKRANGETYVDPKNHLIVDGGLLDNYPIWAFDDVSETNQTLGFMLTSEETKDHLEGSGTIPSTPINNALDFAKALYATQRDKETSDHTNNPKDRARTIYISNKGVSTFDVDIQKQKRVLAKAGREAVRNYFGLRSEEEDTQEMSSTMLSSPS